MHDVDLSTGKSFNLKELHLFRLYRGILYVGLLFLAASLMAAVVAGTVTSMKSATVAREIAPVFLWVGIALSVFGGLCDLALNLALWREAGKDDEEHIAVLSGRKRFERSKKKYKFVGTTDAPPLTPRPPCILPPPRSH